MVLHPAHLDLAGNPPLLSIPTHVGLASMSWQWQWRASSLPRWEQTRYWSAVVAQADLASIEVEIAMLRASTPGLRGRRSWSERRDGPAAGPAMRICHPAISRSTSGVATPINARGDPARASRQPCSRCLATDDGSTFPVRASLRRAARRRGVQSFFSCRRSFHGAPPPNPPLAVQSRNGPRQILSSIGRASSAFSDHSFALNWRSGADCRRGSTAAHRKTDADHIWARPDEAGLSGKLCSRGPRRGP